jgi:hypothetical protein
MRQLLFSIDGLIVTANGEAAIVGTCHGDRILKGDDARYEVKLELQKHVLISNSILIQFRTIKKQDKDANSIEPGEQALVFVPDCLAEQLHLTWYLKGENA